MNEIFEIVRLFVFWLSIGLNVTAFIVNNRAYKRWRQKYDEYVELTHMLGEVLEEQEKILLKFKSKEKQENELHS